MCGEHAQGQWAAEVRVGLSPHVRGAPITKATVPMMNGIIPACAGSTFRPRGHVSGYRDHPRMCGEHSFNIHQFAGEQGSSPHVRGARSGGSSVSLLMGIIPACAGSTKGAFGIQGRHWDHPRMCGEHRISVNTVSSSAGSSPHVRGAHNIVGHLIHITGIIPACAGSTARDTSKIAVFRDHPRMCGEHVRRQSVRQLLTGIIPACAGSTQTHRLHDQPRRDHPRMCGEHGASCYQRLFTAGSSPHVRGAHHR